MLISQLCKFPLVDLSTCTNICISLGIGRFSTSTENGLQLLSRCVSTHFSSWTYSFVTKATAIKVNHDHFWRSGTPPHVCPCLLMIRCDNISPSLCSYLHNPQVEGKLFIVKYMVPEVTNDCLNYQSAWLCCQKCWWKYTDHTYTYI